MFRYLNIPFFITEPNKKLKYIKIDNSNSGYVMRDIDLSEYNYFKNWFEDNYVTK